jgi:hypothetical protein
MSVRTFGHRKSDSPLGKHIRPTKLSILFKNHPLLNPLPSRERNLLPSLYERE